MGAALPKAFALAGAPPADGKPRIPSIGDARTAKPTSTATTGGNKPDLCIITDATGSMGQFMNAVRATLPQLVNVARLTNAFARVGVLTYHDYGDPQVTRWSGWHTSYSGMREFATGLRASGGGDAPEAAKTAIVRFLEYQKSAGGKPCIVIWYADAPPHHALTSSYNIHNEMAALGKDNFDWVVLCARMKAAGATVYPIINTMAEETAAFYMLMADVTGGMCMQVPNASNASSISQATINLMLALLGAPHSFTDETLLGYGTHAAPQFPDQDTVTDEDSPHGFLPCLTKSVSVYAHPLHEMSVAPNASIATDLGPLVARFKEDERYRNTVYDVFSDLLTPADILALTYNTVFGTFWRAICERRKDVRREVLLGQINKTLTALSEDARAAVQTWLDASYNRVADIRALIDDVRQFPALILDDGGTWKAQDLLEVAHSTSPAVISRITQLMAGLRLVDTPVQGDFLPLALTDGELFSLIPHLMAPGTMVSRRPAVIFACVAATLQGSVIAERAVAFLTSVRGKWFDEEINENYSWGFIRFILRAPEVVLTDVERAKLIHLRSVGGLLANGRTAVDVSMRTRLVKASRPDLKQECVSCHVKRSFTLMAASGKCAFCSSGLESRVEPLDDSTSFMCDCCTCSARYAVVDVSALNVRPKCYYCRERKAGGTPTLTCSKCEVAYVVPRMEGVATSSDTTLTFECPMCVAADAPDVESVSVPVAELIDEAGGRNRQCVLAALGLVAPPGTAIHNAGLSIYKSRGVITAVPPARSSPVALTLSGRPVLNGAAVLNAIFEWVHSGTSELGRCAMCFDDLPKHALSPACGRKGCVCVCCKICLTAWYGAVRPGCLIRPGNLQCPFCKRAPASQVLRAAHPRGCELVRASASFDPNWYYAWCIGCYKPAVVMEKGCAQEMPVLAGFTCAPCQETASVSGRATTGACGAAPLTRDCPSCGITVEKEGGCNRISCNCGTKWCWVCRFEAKGDDMELYHHMIREHSGVDDEGE